EDDPREVAREALVEVGEHQGETVVAGCLEDHEMEHVVAANPLLVRARRRRPVPGAVLPDAQPRRRIVEQLLRRAQPVQLLVTQAPGRKRRRATLELASNLVRLAHLARSLPAGACSPAALELRVAGRLQLAPP